MSPVQKPAAAQNVPQQPAAKSAGGQQQGKTAGPQQQNGSQGKAAGLVNKPTVKQGSRAVGAVTPQSRTPGAEVGGTNSLMFRATFTPNFTHIASGFL